jgi:hypothetical protein
MLASHQIDLSSVPDDLKSDLWWMNWHWSRFFSKFFSFPLLIIIPPLLHTRLPPPHEVCNSPDQGAHYHTLGPKLGASSLTWHLAGL